MKRRGVLAGASLFAVLFGAGCFGSLRDDASTVDNADLFHIVGDAYRPARYDPREQDTPRYRLVTGEETALEVLQTEPWSQDDGDHPNRPENVTARDGALDGLEEFIKNTNFGDEFLVIVADGYYTSRHWFEVAHIDRDGDDSLSLSIRVEAEKTVDDAHPHTGVVRIWDEEVPSPDTFSVSVDRESAERFAD